MEKKYHGDVLFDKMFQEWTQKEFFLGDVKDFQGSCISELRSIADSELPNRLVSTMEV